MNSQDSSSVLTPQIGPANIGYTPPNPTNTGNPPPSQQTVNDLSSNVSTSPTIDASKLNTTPVVTPTPAQNTTDSFLNSLSVGNPAAGIPSTSSLNTDVTNAQNATDQTSNDIQNLLTQLGYKSSDTTNLQNSMNISGLQKNLNDLNTQYAQKKAAYDQQFQNIGAQNIPTLFTTGQMAIAKAAAASDLGSMAAQIQAAQGNLNTAFNTIDKTITEKYQPIIDQINQQQKFYEINKDKLTAAQSRLAMRQSQIFDLQKQAIQNNQSLFSQAQKDLADQVSKAGIDPQVGFKALGDLLNGKITLGDFYSQIGMPGSGQTTGGNIANAISAVESGGSYTSVGKTLTSGENAGYAALGKYQIMPNLWFATIGLDPNSEADKQKFLNSPALQDQLFQTIMDTLTKQYGGDQAKAIAAYFGGDAAAQAYGTPAGDKITDGNMTVNQYVNSVMSKLNEQNAPSYNQYGLLANTDFNPSNFKDQAAETYLNQYLKNGTYPTAASIFGRATNNRGLSLPQVQQRAQDLFFAATGQSLPDVQVLKGNKSLINANNKLANNLSIQDQTVIKNFALNVDNLTKSNIDSNAMPFLNSMQNWINTALGDPATGAMIAQNTTLQNELGSLLAIKNATGTTVHDKLESAGLIGKNDSIDVQKAKLKIILQEAQNAKQVINDNNAQLYAQIDPLQTDPNNPNRTATNTTSGQSNVQKGNMSDSDFVHQSLVNSKIDYNTFISGTPSGQMPVIDNSTGQAGYIPTSEFDKSKYTQA